jgi:hypothetical protein
MPAIRRLLLVAALVAGVVASGTAAAAAAGPVPERSVGIRLLDAPAGRAADPRAQLYVVDHVRPGATVTRRVELANGTRRPVRLGLYAAGAEVEQGRFRFLDGPATNELAGWTRVRPGQVLVPARGTANATVTIAVPADASAGERYAVVWAELPRSVPTGGGVSAVNRVGVRVYLSVGPGGEPPSRFVIESVTAERAGDGRPVVVVRVRNRGGRALDLSGELRRSGGPGGLRAGPFPVQLGTTLGVGDAGFVRVPLDPAVPDGPWRVRITLRSGAAQGSASATAAFPARPGSAAAEVPATAVPAAAGRGSLAMGGGVLALGLGAWGLLRRQRGRRLRRSRR